MEQRISVVTLGVADLGRAQAFYAALGWTRGHSPDGEVAFFQAGGMVLSLWDRAKLEEEAGLGDSGGTGGISLGYIVRSREEVDSTLEAAAAAGGSITRPAQETFWGGYSGYFADLDGHAWEVADNPAWPLGDDGAVKLPY